MDMTDSALHAVASQPAFTCPRCGMAVTRVRRTLLDRLSSFFVPQLRVRCDAAYCGWQGLVRRDTPGTASFQRSRAYRPQHVLEASHAGRAEPLPPATRLPD
jgi:hypothetical protein